MPSHETFEPLEGFEAASCLCIGTGRFLRAVLLPAMREMGAGARLDSRRPPPPHTHSSPTPTHPLTPSPI